jgi:hypothetical protein
VGVRRVDISDPVPPPTEWATETLKAVARLSHVTNEVQEGIRVVHGVHAPETNHRTGRHSGGILLILASLPNKKKGAMAKT